MPRTRKPAISANNIQGLKYFKRLQPLFASLHDIGVDPSGNRQLHYDQYASLILLFFNPTLTSLRGLQQASCLEKGVCCSPRAYMCEAHTITQSPQQVSTLGRMVLTLAFECWVPLRDYLLFRPFVRGRLASLTSQYW